MLGHELLLLRPVPAVALEHVRGTLAIRGVRSDDRAATVAAERRRDPEVGAEVGRRELTLWLIPRPVEGIDVGTYSQGSDQRSGSVGAQADRVAPRQVFALGPRGVSSRENIGAPLGADECDPAVAADRNRPAEPIACDPDPCDELLLQKPRRPAPGEDVRPVVFGVSRVAPRHADDHAVTGRAHVDGFAELIGRQPIWRFERLLLAPQRLDDDRRLHLVLAAGSGRGHQPSQPPRNPHPTSLHSRHRRSVPPVASGNDAASHNAAMRSRLWDLADLGLADALL